MPRGVVFLPADPGLTAPDGAVGSYRIPLTVTAPDGTRSSVPITVDVFHTTTLYDFESGTTQGWQAGANVTDVRAVSSFANGPGRPHGGNYALQATGAQNDASQWRVMSVMPAKPLDLSKATHLVLWFDCWGGIPVTSYQVRVVLHSGADTRPLTAAVTNDRWNRLDLNIADWAGRSGIYTDGTHQAVTSNDSWTWSTGAISSNDIYNGESYDARLEQSGWDTAGYNASAWKPVATVPAPSKNLVADAMPPLRVVQTLRPVRLSEAKPGVWVFDLGQNIAGWARLSVQGAAGTTVTMQTAEELKPDGTLDTTTNRQAQSTDRYTLAGTGSVETYEPRFTYHGFRYVEVTGFPGTPTLASLDGRVVHADVASNGELPVLGRVAESDLAQQPLDDGQQLDEYAHRHPGAR
jgi:hypothetical protein